MKQISTLLLSYFFIQNIHAQSGEWAWMKGDSTYYSLIAPNTPVGIEDPSINPPNLFLASSWSDDSGYLYLFGGFTYAPQFNTAYFYDYIWRFNTITNNWMLRKGDNSGARYGQKGIADSINNPGSRVGAIIWKDNNGLIWMFGGNDSYGTFNDLWTYNTVTNNWTWMGGQQGSNNYGTGIMGHYGTKGVPSPDNLPPPRENAAAWIDNNNNLWLFGGYCNCSSGEFYNDLWEYDTKINEWIWVGGKSTTQDLGHYGFESIPDTNNLPQARSCWCSWKDNQDNFYLYGGTVRFNLSDSKGDVWKYSVANKTWVWINGDSTVDFTGITNQKCDFNPENYPSSRSLSVCLQDGNTVWIFGGLVDLTDYRTSGRDLWKYDLLTNEFSNTWGDSSYEFRGNFNQQGIFNLSNDPRSRNGAVGWTDNNKNIWIYGGEWGVGSWGESDLWEYIPDSNCALVSGIASIKPSDNILIYPNPAKDELKVSFPFSNNIISILDLFGRELKQLKVENGNLKLLDLSFLQQGVYVVEIKDEKGNVIAEQKLFRE